MSWQAICAVIVLVSHASYGCIPQDELYVTTPQNVTKEVGQSTAFFCVVNANLSSNLYFYSWSYEVNGQVRAFDVNDNPFNFGGGDSNLSVPNIVSDLNGARFQCSISNAFRNNPITDQLCGTPSEVPKVSAFLSVQAPPTIILSPTTYTVATQGRATVLVTIQGYPRPTISLYGPRNGMQTLVSDGSDRRVSITRGLNDVYNITVSEVVRADRGEYRIVARNALNPKAEVTFFLNVTGLDPPVVNIAPSEVVENYNAAVNLDCKIQEEAYNQQTTSIQWSSEGTPISADASSELYTTDHENGTVSLTIKALLSHLVGMYTCTANNGQTDSKTANVFGPPPSPIQPVSQVTGGSVFITWRRPDQSSIITQYLVTIYSGSMEVSSQRTEVYADDHTSGSITVSGLKAGEYQFTVTSLARNVTGVEGPRVPFTVDKPFPIAIVAGAAAGGLVAAIIILFLIITGIYCCCKCYASRKKISSQQQRWGSEEEKMAGNSHAPTVQNTYTALALNDSSDLPPSPMSPMTSAMGIDPKWEFPRENIDLQDELAVGQFTVLYKGVAKGLKDNRSCNVAVKSLRDGATEDDLKALIYEMDMLATIEEHANIVSLLRVCTVGKPVFMVMEYMCHGDLLGFLRSCRGYRGMYAVSPGPRYQPPALQLCSRDLLNMATKIANGMRFLADRKIVHRALCAKNILVGAGMDVKIYNVGSFDIPIDTGDGLAKWMAPETLFDGTNTTYSDVWSFGVAMWELVTIGGTPYADIPAEELYAQLQGGMRMPCPPHCAQEVYDIIGACWQKNPQERPHFAIIHENLDELVMSKLSYLDLRNYDSQTYTDFINNVPKSTPL